MKKTRKVSPSKYLRRYGKAKPSRPDVTKEEVEAVLERALTDEQYEELVEASRMYSLSNSDKHVNLAQDAEHNRDWEGAKKHWKNAALASIKHDATHKTNRSDKLKVRGITMRKEEVEQIDELSKKTLGSYIKKASKNAAVDALQSGASLHNAMIQGAIKSKLMPRPTEKSIKTGVSSSLNRSKKRLTGIETASDKLSKEEVEPITELSKNTLKSYVKKAVPSRDSHLLHASHYAARSSVAKTGSDERFINNKRANKHLSKSLSRTIGISNAKAKLGEGVELSASRKDKVNSLLAKHQAKGLPTKSTKKYTREYTGDGLPQIMATINQEETIHEGTQHNHVMAFGKKEPKGKCPRCDEMHDGSPVIQHRGRKARHDLKKKMEAHTIRDIKNHDCKKLKCGPVCTFGEW